MRVAAMALAAGSESRGLAKRRREEIKDGIAVVVRTSAQRDADTHRELMGQDCPV